MNLPERKGDKTILGKLLFIRNAQYWSLKQKDNPGGNNLAKFFWRPDLGYVFGVKEKFYVLNVKELLSTASKVEALYVREQYGTIVDIRTPKEDHLYLWHRVSSKNDLHKVILAIDEII